MPCTTILVGKKASWDGSTLMARNEDASAGNFAPKKFIVVEPKDQPKLYESVISHVKIPLPDDPMRYTCVPNALPNKGLWSESGFNTENVAMSATETITSNARVLGADPLVDGGIGEEDMVTIVLPYIHSARDGVQRMGALLKGYGTYEMNGIGFQDKDEIWWLETIGGHHWIAKRVPDDEYAVVPNQLGIQTLDLTDAFGAQENFMCSADLREWIAENHLNTAMSADDSANVLDVRACFGSHDDSDHAYNTPRAWFMHRALAEDRSLFEGPDAIYHPESDDLPWSLVPAHRIGIEDIKYVLSGHMQQTPFDPFDKRAPEQLRGKYRPIGINRNNFVMITQMRPDVPQEFAAVEWIAMGCNIFNTFVPFYANCSDTPAYLRDCTGRVTTENAYWQNRVIAALCDAHFSACSAHINRYNQKVLSMGHAFLRQTDAEAAKLSGDALTAYLTAANERMAEAARAETDDLLGKVLYDASNEMKSGYSMNDC